MFLWLAAVVAAWQAFATDPFTKVYAGHIRAFWAVDVPEPAWVKDTFAGLAIASYDGKTLDGEVDLWAAAGLDVKQCAVEVVWDTRGKHGVRVETVTRTEPGAGGGVHAFWKFSAPVGAAPQILGATAYVFCPIDRKHVTPPWGAMFTSIEMTAAGPKAKQEYCANPRFGEAAGVGNIDGRRTYDLGFACGVLPRMRGRDLVDDCKGDVMLSLDTLGKTTQAAAPVSGTPPNDEELSHYLAGSSQCAHFELSGFNTNASRAFAAAAKHMGKRLTMAFSRDGMKEPDR